MKDESIHQPRYDKGNRVGAWKNPQTGKFHVLQVVSWPEAKTDIVLELFVYDAETASAVMDGLVKNIQGLIRVPSGCLLVTEAGPVFPTCV